MWLKHGENLLNLDFVKCIEKFGKSSLILRFQDSGEWGISLLEDIEPTPDDLIDSIAESMRCGHEVFEIRPIERSKK